MAHRYESFEFTAPANGQDRFQVLQATESFRPHLRAIAVPNNANLLFRVFRQDQQIAEFRGDIQTGWGEYRVLDQLLAPNEILDVEVENLSGGGITDRVDILYTVED